MQFNVVEIENTFAEAFRMCTEELGCAESDIFPPERPKFVAMQDIMANTDGAGQ